MSTNLRRYHLPSENGEGWAIIVLGDDGFFAAISDYGNYAHLWNHHGCKDVREFFLSAGESWDYFLRKLSPRPWNFDGEKTFKTVKQAILEYRRNKWLEKDEARYEWNLLVDSGLKHGGILDFGYWYERTKIGDAYDLAVYSPPSDAFVFVKKVFPRWVKILKKELEDERKLD